MTTVTITATLTATVDQEFLKVLLEKADSVVVHDIPVSFRRLGGGWVIGSTTFGSMVGFEYIRAALRDGEVDSMEIADRPDPALAANRVAPAIRRAREAIASKEPAIAAHLEQSLTAGHKVSYVGTWSWNL